MIKRITLLGDSIRLGYEATVRKELADIAEVWSPADNGQHSTHTLMNFQAWVVEPKPDLIHVNFGLWDCRRVSRQHNDNLVPLAHYRDNVASFLRLAAAATGACLIWATTTPVLQDRHRAKFTAAQDPFRVAADISLYNAAALDVAAAAQVPVNDLHAFVTNCDSSRLICDDGVHYTEEGSTLLGREVADIIRKQLSP